MQLQLSPRAATGLAVGCYAFIVVVYACAIYSQRYNLKWYLPAKIKIWLFCALSLIFGYLTAELGHFLAARRFLLHYSIPVIVIFGLLGAPVLVIIRVNRIYRETAPSARPRNQHWRHFGPYLVPRNASPPKMVIIWGSRGPNGPTAQGVHIGNAPETLQFSPTRVTLRKGQINIWQYAVDLQNYPQGFYYQAPMEEKIYFVPPRRFPQDSTKLRGLLDHFEIQFCVLSDIHADDNDIHAEMAQLRKTMAGSDFVISAGDNVTFSTYKAWGQFFAQFGRFLADKPLLTCPGNHDGGSRRAARVWQAFFPYHFEAQTEKGHVFSFFHTMKAQNTLMLFLDLYNAGKKPRIPSARQLEYFKGCLQENANVPHKILVLHNSIYCSGEFGCDNELNRLLMPEIQQYGFDAVISGHAHIFEAFYRPNKAKNTVTAFIVAGGSGGKLDSIVLKPKGFLTVPYYWKTPIHRAGREVYLGGILDSPFRNDKAIIEYQDFGVLAHSFVNFAISAKPDHTEFVITAIDWAGKELYSRHWTKSN